MRTRLDAAKKSANCAVHPQNIKPSIRGTNERLQILKRVFAGEHVLNLSVSNELGVVFSPNQLGQRRDIVDLGEAQGPDGSVIQHSLMLHQL
jgi:hypothetical protein